MLRCFIFLDTSIYDATDRVVFEPNGNGFWMRVRQWIEQFLHIQWQAEVFMELDEEEAFFVYGDRATMTRDELDNGRSIAEVGVAPVKPADFVIFRIAHFPATRDAA